MLYFTTIAALAVASPVFTITGGSVAPKLGFPYMASVRWSGQHTCGGVLIDETTILTAASCVDALSVGSTTVRLGLNTLGNPEKGYQESAVSRIIKHPDWDVSSPWNNDISFLKLSNPISRLTPAKLPKADTSPAPGDIVTIAGWGVTSSGGSYPPGSALREARLPIISLSDCRAAYPRESLSDNVFCDAVANGGKGACAGDQGGPVIASDGALVGIISGPMDVDACGSAKSPGVSVNVSKYLEWIQGQQVMQSTEVEVNAKKADL